MMRTDSEIYVAGHLGMVGSAIYRQLESAGHHNLIGRTSKELDLRNQQQVEGFFEAEKPEFVFVAAAKVGGIHANNTYRAEFIYDNLMIASNVIHAAYKHGVKKLLFLGSSCIYPRDSPDQLKEEHLLTGKLEPTNEPYAIAKIAGIKLCESYRDQYGCNFISAMPTNIYGRGDNYELNNSHVLPALIRRFHEAKLAKAASVEVWGTGRPEREFLFADDLADACVYLMNNYDGREFVNLGSGQEISISELANLVKTIVGFEGRIDWNSEKPDGTLKKRLDLSKMNQLGWKSSMNLTEGIRQAYIDFLGNKTRLND